MFQPCINQHTACSRHPKQQKYYLNTVQEQVACKNPKHAKSLVSDGHRTEKLTLILFVTNLQTNSFA